MITDEELAELPEDSELAFVEFERIVRARLREAEQQEDRNYTANSERLEYINKMIAAAKVYNIDGLCEWEVPKVDSDIHKVYNTN